MLAQRPGKTVVGDMIVTEMNDRHGLRAPARSERREGSIEVSKRGCRRQHGRFEHGVSVNTWRMARPAARGGFANLNSGECAKNRRANVGHERPCEFEPPRDGICNDKKLDL